MVLAQLANIKAHIGGFEKEHTKYTHTQCVGNYLTRCSKTTQPTPKKKTTHMYA